MNWLTVLSVTSLGNLSVILLTGGTSRRFGSDKSRAFFRGLPLRDFIVRQLPGELPLVIVGPDWEVGRPGVTFVRESPVGGGPLAGLAAALPAINTDYFFLIATDLPFAPLVLEQLLTEWVDEVDAVLPLDSEGVAQPFCALFRTERVIKRVREFGDPTNRSIRSFISTLNTLSIALRPQYQPLLADVDTQEDLVRLAEDSERLLLGIESENEE